MEHENETPQEQQAVAPPETVETTAPEVKVEIPPVKAAGDDLKLLLESLPDRVAEAVKATLPQPPKNPPRQPAAVTKTVEPTTPDPEPFTPKMRDKLFDWYFGKAK